MEKLAALLFMIFQAECEGVDVIQQMGMTPRALATICGPEAQLGCVKVLFDTPWNEPVCYMYTLNSIYEMWNPQDAEGFFNDKEEPLE